MLKINFKKILLYSFLTTFIFILDRLSKLNFKHFHVHLPSANYFENIGRNNAKVQMETGQIISNEYLDMIDYVLRYPNLSHFHTHSAPGKELHKEIDVTIKPKEGTGPPCCCDKQFNPWSDTWVC